MTHGRRRADWSSGSEAKEEVSSSSDCVLGVCTPRIVIALWLAGGYLPAQSRSQL
ncbi:hypothetical protein F442_08528 [Phytophthora nicotianae P10297]|uniref:Uncharacterized protein n=3 Tax=Phytophthora nicotianae TaxID=4792 RepID=V9F6I1_PHYNI|nr:hypothetical protein F443_08588 [Phytophthora nicotianae P1569]ETL95004.1 hypothetical protein L917_07122 [Phytophthora nicotianae]ETM48245.1 hypothetical protein L914_07182 [Phytophthora nicotianae]ETP44952.1 hypothetical protein F442_08528 [Phytophthora nicotianae P10297]